MVSVKGGGSMLKTRKIIFSPLLYKYFIVSNVVIYLYIYCLYAINVQKCIKFDNLQVKVVAK